MSPARAHVAVIDDDAPVRRALVRVLAAAGYAVTSYGSAEEFLAVDDEWPQCVLADMHLPRMDGLELSEYLRRGRHGIPIVLITADHDLARSTAVRATGAPCLTKPVDEHTLVDAIARVAPSLRNDC